MWGAIIWELWRILWPFIKEVRVKIGQDYDNRFFEEYKEFCYNYSKDQGYDFAKMIHRPEDIGKFL